MEYCMAARALKPSLRTVGFKELAIMNATTQQALREDFLCLNATAASTSGEDFSVVDCFFDFSNGEFKDSAFIQEQNHLGDEEEEEKDYLSVSSQDRAEDDNSTNSSIFSDYHLRSELSLPEEDNIAELEWVSHYVYDDSSPEISLLCPVPGGLKTKSDAENQSEPETKPVLSRVPPFLGVRVPGKERTKKARLPSQAWPVVGNWLTESSPAASPASSSSSSTPCLVPTSAVPTFDLSPGFGEPPAKKQKKKPAVQTEGDIGSVQFQRRCSHCQVQKTPQWRTGPLGPKTLCNACGVRYKSGRLFPEYRPACSPTFSSDVHSNSHRKVLEMRKKKEAVGPEDGMNRILPDYGLNQMVPSF